MNLSGWKSWIFLVRRRLKLRKILKKIMFPEVIIFLRLKEFRAEFMLEAKLKFIFWIKMEKQFLKEKILRKLKF